MLRGDDVVIRRSVEFEAQEKVWEDVRKVVDGPLFADFKLVAKDGTEITCHKLILAARSKFFRTMFEVCRSEGFLVLKEMDGEVLQAFVDFIYGRPVERSPEMASDLAAALDKYDVVGSDAIRNYLADRQ